jgi:hypothetical protein
LIVLGKKILTNPYKYNIVMELAKNSPIYPVHVFLRKIPSVAGLELFALFLLLLVKPCIMTVPGQ